MHSLGLIDRIKFFFKIKFLKMIAVLDGGHVVVLFHFDEEVSFSVATFCPRDMALVANVYMLVPESRVVLLDNGVASGRPYIYGWEYYESGSENDCKRPRRNSCEFELD